MIAKFQRVVTDLAGDASGGDIFSKMKGARHEPA